MLRTTRRIALGLMGPGHGPAARLLVLGIGSRRLRTAEGASAPELEEELDSGHAHLTSPPTAGRSTGDFRNYPSPRFQAIPIEKSDPPGGKVLPICWFYAYPIIYQHIK